MNTKILTLCQANRCRSMLLEAAIRKAASEYSAPVEVYSAGINSQKKFGVSPSVGEVDQCARFGLDISKHSSKYATQESVEGADLVLVSDRDALDKLVEQYPKVKDKAHLVKEYVAGRGLPSLEADLDEPWFPRNGKDYKGYTPKSLQADYAQYNEMIRLGQRVLRILGGK